MRWQNKVREERGAAAILFALALPILIGMVAFVTDLGYAYYSKQTLQDTLDLAAIAAARQLDGGTGAIAAATTAARTVLDDNGFTDFSLASGCSIPVTDNAVFLCLGSYAAKDSSGSLQYPLSSRFTPGGTSQKAVRLSAQGDSPSFFARIFGIDELDYLVQSTAARGGSNLAQLTIRSALVSASPNLVLGLLGGNGSLTVLGSNGIATANINLLTFLNALAPSVGVAAGNYDQVLGAQVSIGTLLTTAATVLDTGTTAGLELTSLNTAGSGFSAAIRQATVRLSDLINLQTGTAAAGLDMTINALDLIQGGLMAANGVNALQGGVSLGTSNSSILNGIATVTVKFAVVEPPQLSAIGDPALAKAAADQRLGAGAIYVRTGQLRLYISIQLPVLNTITTAVNNLLASNSATSALVSALNSALSLNISGLLTSVLGLLIPIPQHKTIFDIQVLPTPRLDVSLDLAAGEAYVTDYTCPTGNGDKTLTVKAASSAAIVRVGTMDAAAVFSSTTPVAVKPLPILNIRTRSGTFCRTILGNCIGYPQYDGPWLDYGGGGLALWADTTVAGTTYSSSPPYGTPPDPPLPEIGAAPFYKSHSASSIIGSLKTTLSGLHFDSYQAAPGNANLIGTVLTGVVTTLSTVTNLLTPIVTLLSNTLDSAIASLLSLLGIDLAKVDVGANLTCNDARLVN